jgi:hypothetical protein
LCGHRPIAALRRDQLDPSVLAATLRSSARPDVRLDRLKVTLRDARPAAWPDAAEPKVWAHLERRPPLTGPGTMDPSSFGKRDQIASLLV